MNESMIGRRGLMRSGLLLALLWAFGSAAQAQSPSAVYLYQGADRAQRLLDQARQEGTLVLYTSLATTESIPLTQAFEKKYGVKVQLWRSLSENVLARTITEARGRRHGVDVIETNSPELEALAREQLISQFISPHAGSVHAWAVPAHRLWIGDRVDLFVAAFNTDRVRREEMPESYEGFLDAKWKGRLALEATDQEWLGAIVKHWGEARGTSFFRRLADMQPDMRKGHVLLAQLVAAGEVPVGLTVYSGNAESIKRKGGPVDWAAVEPLVGRVQGLALAKNAPHPHAALLFADFVLSPEGMQLLHAFGRVPTSRDVKTVMDETSYVLVDPAQPAAETVRWQRMWKDLFGR
jgi:iron(III) transport system substrate-binding protein